MAVYKDEKRNTWYVSINVKDANTEKWKKQFKRGFRTKKEAKEWEATAPKIINVVVTVTEEQKKKTFREMASEWEISNQAKEEVKTKHREHFERRFADFVDTPIEDITRQDLQQWRTKLIGMDGAYRTKNQTISFVKSVFRYANEAYNIQNPTMALKSIKASDQDVMKEMEVWTPDEFSQFIEEVTHPLYRTFFEFLYWTGCRRGEAIGIQKCDVSDHWVTIRYSQRTAEQGLKPTKTKLVRSIRIDNKLWDHLQPLLNQEGSYLFGGNAPLSPTSISRYFNKGIKASGVKRIRIHDLRHSHATWLINNGVAITAVSKRLGHATIDQTLKTYTHLLKSADDQLMNLIEMEKEKRPAVLH